MERIFLISDYVVVLTPQEWEQYKLNLPVLDIGDTFEPAVPKEKYEGGTKYFNELEGDLLKKAATFVIKNMTLSEDMLNECLQDTLIDVRRYAENHSRLFETYEDFKIGKLHRIHCFHLIPEPKILSTLLRNEMRHKMLTQIESMLDKGEPVIIENIVLSDKLSDYMWLIKQWYQTYNGINDFCEDMSIEFGYEDAIPLV